MPDALIVDDDGTLDAWIDGLRSFGADFGDAVEGEWQTATERLYDRSQEFVHVLSSALKQTGFVDVFRTDTMAVGIVTYGGEALINGESVEVDYAIFEHERDGEHAFLKRAWDAVGERAFGSALTRAFDRTVRTWK